MEIFNAKKNLLLKTKRDQIPNLVNELRREFERDHFLVTVSNLADEGKLVTIEKGNSVEGLIGIRLCQKIWLTPRGERILFDTMSDRNDYVAGFIALFVFWGFFITIFVGKYKQAKVCKRAIMVAERIQEANMSNNI